MSNTIKKNFKFIDLFAGIGGFHQAMRRLGGKCVFACEKDEKCKEMYNHNYNKDNKIIIHDDIRTVIPEEIPEFDVLCGGFPCQPFSKAGKQQGFQDKGRGDLFYKILPIIDAHPEIKFIILENVRNLADNEANWNVIKTELMQREFYITQEPIILSPHEFGIPQKRERVYILGVKKEYRDNSILTNGYIHIEDLDIEKNKKKCPNNSLPLILDQNVNDKYNLSDDKVKVMNQWNDFKLGLGMPGYKHPIWLNCFGVNLKNTELFKKKSGYYDMPEWKKSFFDYNRQFYLEHKEFIDKWIEEYHIMSDRNKLYRKFEWNCGADCDEIKDGIIQIRQSGIRVKRPNYFPSLVAMNNTPIIWDNRKHKYRYITPHEASKLQSFDDDIEFIGTDADAYKQLGNSVNVDIIEMLAKKLFRLGMWRKEYVKKN